jgi:hypothetical protein
MQHHCRGGAEYPGIDAHVAGEEPPIEIEVETDRVALGPYVTGKAKAAPLRAAA